MLHIVHAVHQRMFPDKKLKSFYVSEKKTFSEVDEFMAAAISEYGLVSRTYEEPMKAALARMLGEDTELEATMLGVRTGDPGLSLVTCQRTFARASSSPNKNLLSNAIKCLNRFLFVKVLVVAVSGHYYESLQSHVSFVS